LVWRFVIVNSVMLTAGTRQKKKMPLPKRLLRAG
jgi:hypothetical protein